MQVLKFLFCVILFLLFNGFVSNPIQNEKAGIIKITFLNTINNVPIVINDSIYKNSFGENYSIKSFKYYISNFKIANSTNSFSEKNSYHLIDESDKTSQTFSFNVIPNNYTFINFLVGVDSLHNVSGAQTDALDPLNGMFWTWNTGYIMAKLEGNAVASNVVNNKFEYHIGGFNKTNNVVKKITLQLDATNILKIKKDKVTEILIDVNIDKWWQSNGNVKITENPVCTTPGALAKKIADNYCNMFSIKKIITY